MPESYRTFDRNTPNITRITDDRIMLLLNISVLIDFFSKIIMSTTYVNFNIILTSCTILKHFTLLNNRSRKIQPEKLLEIYFCNDYTNIYYGGNKKRG